MDDNEFQTWKNSEYEKNKKFAKIPIPFKGVKVLKVLVIDGKGIDNGFPVNLIDDPNPQIVLEYDHAQGSKIHKTSSKFDTKNPVWNEMLTFVMKEKDAADDILKIKLLDTSWMWNTSLLAKSLYDLSKISIGEEREVKISFGQIGSVRLRISKQLKTSPDLRLSLSLSEPEMNFRMKRIPRVMTALQHVLDDQKDAAPRNLFDTPVMSVVGSGGGFRAMVGFTGVIEGLDKIGILDCLTYAFGTSGSAWYLSSAYSRKSIHGKRRKRYHSWLRKSFRTSGYWEAIKISNISRCIKIQRKKRLAGQPCTFVDYYGLCVANKVVGKKFASAKVPDIKGYVENGDVPYPILNSNQVLDSEFSWEYRTNCDFTPHEIEVPEYGVSVDINKANSEYHAGVVARQLPEPELSFVLGTLGSVFGVGISRMLGIEKVTDKEIMKNSSNRQFFTEKVAKRDSTFWESLMDWLGKLQLFRDRNEFIVRTGKYLNFVKGLSNLERFAMNPNKTVGQETVDGFKESSDTLSLVDGGVLCNVAVGSALRPQRGNDVLFVCDFTGYGGNVDFETLETAVVLSEQNGCKFPTVDIERIKKSEVKELYVFDDQEDPDCPLVFWFMMSTIRFRTEKNYKPRNNRVLKQLKPGEEFTDFKVYDADTHYGTFDLTYSELDFERLRELMFYNVTINEQVIKQKIGQKIKAKRRNAVNGSGSFHE